MASFTPALGLTIVGTTVRTTELVIDLIKTTEKVQRLPAECNEINSYARMLRDVLAEHKDALANQATSASLDEFLQELIVFANHCRDSDPLRRAWEIKWTEKLPKLKMRLIEWLLFFITETSVCECRVNSTRSLVNEMKGISKVGDESSVGTSTKSAKTAVEAYRRYKT